MRRFAYEVVLLFALMAGMRQIANPRKKEKRKKMHVSVNARECTTCICLHIQMRVNIIIHNARALYLIPNLDKQQHIFVETEIEGAYRLSGVRFDET